MNRMRLSLIAVLCLGTVWADSITLTIDSGTKTLAEALAAYNAANGTSWDLAALNGGSLKSTQIVKAGAGTLQLVGQIAAYVGSWDVQAGQVNCTNVYAFGAASAAVYVRKGARVKVATVTGLNSGRAFHIAGSGTSNNGALANADDTRTGWNGQTGTMGNIYLDDDAQINVAQWRYAFDSVHLNGKTLTVTSVSGSVATGAPHYFGNVYGAGKIIDTGRPVRLDNGQTLEWDDATAGNELLLQGGGYWFFGVGYHTGNGRDVWKFTFDSANGIIRGDVDHNRSGTACYKRSDGGNTFFGPVEFRQNVAVSQQGTSYDVVKFRGPVSGSADFQMTDASFMQFVHFFNANNTHAGTIKVNAGLVNFYEPGSLSPQATLLLARTSERPATDAIGVSPGYYGAEFFSPNAHTLKALQMSGICTGRVQGGFGKWATIERLSDSGTTEYYSALDAGKVTLKGGVFKLPRGAEPGLYEGVTACADATAVAAAFAGSDYPKTYVMRGPQSSNQIPGENFTESSATTLITYDGYIWNRTGADEKVSFASSVKGPVKMLIDGEAVLTAAAGGALAEGSVTLTPGAHHFQYRTYNNAPVTAKKGFAWRTGGTTGKIADYSVCVDAGDGALFTLTDDATALPVFDEVVGNGGALDVNGNAFTLAQVSGVLAVTNSAADTTSDPSLTVGTYSTDAADLTASPRLTSLVPLSFGDTGHVVVTNCASLADGIYTIVRASAPIACGGREAAALVTLDDTESKWTADFSEGGRVIVLHRAERIEFEIGSGTTTITDVLKAYNEANGTAYTLDDFSGTLKGCDIVKKGAGTLTLDQAISGFVGRIVVEEGKVLCNARYALGAESNTIVVKKGAQIVIAAGVTNAGRTFEIAGTGPDGKGALVGPSARVSYSERKYFGSYLRLTDDATMSVGEWYFATDVAAVLNGYKLTIKGSGSTSAFYCGKYLPSVVGAGKVEFNGSSWRFGTTVTFTDATPGNKVTFINGGMRFFTSTLNGPGASAWTFDCASGKNCLFCDEVGAMTREDGVNTLWGTLNVAAEVQIASQGNTENGRLYLRGPVTGSASLYDTVTGNEPSYVHFLNPSNTYSGTFTVQMGVGYVYAPGTFPKAATMKVQAAVPVQHHADSTYYGTPGYFGAAFLSPETYDLGTLKLTGANGDRVQGGSGT